MGMGKIRAATLQQRLMAGTLQAPAESAYQVSALQSTLEAVNHVMRRQLQHSHCWLVSSVDGRSLRATSDQVDGDPLPR